MLTIPRHHRAWFAAIAWAVGGGLSALLSAPGRADVAPESGLLAHVRPVSGSCGTPITHCSEIVRSTSQSGPIEFLIFFMRGAYAWPGETVCLWSIDNELSWPDAWQLVAFEPCGGSVGTLDPQGATHRLHLQWVDYYGIEDRPGGVLPVARLVMNVAGAGRLDIVKHYGENPIMLMRDCDMFSTFVTYPVQVYAEAGMTCGYIAAHCGYDEARCEPRFSVDDLELRAAPGAVADTTIGFSAILLGHIPCDVVVDTHAPWCEAWVTSLNQSQRYLRVRADASGLSAAVHETAVELRAVEYSSVSRCLPVTFTVDAGPVPVEAASWGRIKSLYR